MKYRNKHYVELKKLPFLIFPFIAFSVGITLWFNSPHKAAHFTYPDYPETSTIDRDKLLEFGNPLDENGADVEKVTFDFTGDTVLMLKGSDLFNIAPGRRKILYKTKEGELKTVDVPFSQLTAISADTSEANE